MHVDETTFGHYMCHGETCGPIDRLYIAGCPGGARPHSRPTC